MLAILQALSESKERLSSADVMKITNLSAGTVYPVLGRMITSKWVTSEKEAGNASKLGRPLKTLFKLIVAGKRNVNKKSEQIKDLNLNLAISL